MAATVQHDRLLTLREAASRLGISERTLRAWAASGRMPCVRLSSRCVRVDPRDLEKYIAARRDR